MTRFYHIDVEDDKATKQQRLADEWLAHQAAEEYDDMNKLTQIENKVSKLLDDHENWHMDGKTTMVYKPLNLHIGFGADRVAVYRGVDSLELSNSAELLPKIEAMRGDLMSDFDRQLCDDILVKLNG